jgi:hypothetical protein
MSLDKWFHAQVTSADDVSKKNSPLKNRIAGQLIIDSNHLRKIFPITNPQNESLEVESDLIDHQALSLMPEMKLLVPYTYDLTIATSEEVAIDENIQPHHLEPNSEYLDSAKKFISDMEEEEIADMCNDQEIEFHFKVLPI